MNICLIEDDDYKADDLGRALKSALPDGNIVIGKNYREGAVLLKEEWDLIVLDMQLPLFEEEPKGKVYSFAGERMLRQLERTRKSASVIVVTQYTTFSELLDEVDFEGLVKRLEEGCPNVFKGAIQYSFGETAWKFELEKILLELGI
jgi:hypothetical protein